MFVSKKFQSGFTLIEVMIVVAILGILAGIAYPSYMESVRKSNRSDAKSELNDVAQRLQRCFTAYSAYNHASCTVAGNISGGDKIVSRERMYEITGQLAATSYTLTATPTGAQANDNKCQSFTLGHDGARGANGKVPDTDGCW